jgi:hypothetical protein
MQQTGFCQLIEGEPDHVLINRFLDFISQTLGQLCHACLSVASVPNESGSLVKTVGLVSVRIVHQHFL